MRHVYFCVLFCAFALLSGCETIGSPSTDQAISTDTATGFTINPATGWPDTGSSWTKGTSTVTGMGAWNVALSLPVGSTVPPIAATVIDGSTSVVAMMLVSYAGASWTVLAQVNSIGGGAQTVRLTASHVVTATESLVLRFTTPGSSTAPTIGSIGIGAALSSTTITVPFFPDFISASGLGGVQSSSILSRSLFLSATNGVAFPVAAVPSGVTISSVTAKLSDGTGAPISVGLLSKEMATTVVPVWRSLGTTLSDGSGSLQSVSANVAYIVPPNTDLAVAFTANSISVPLVIYQITLNEN